VVGQGLGRNFWVGHTASLVWAALQTSPSLSVKGIGACVAQYICALLWTMLPREVEGGCL
jgi:hypothetical protein